MNKNEGLFNISSEYYDNTEEEPPQLETPFSQLFTSVAEPKSTTNSPYIVFFIFVIIY